jgi:hypothetical protein
VEVTVRRTTSVVTAVVLALLVAGCAERASRPATTEGTATARGAAPAANAGKPLPPADSPLAKITTGMGMGDVASILGQPTDQHQYATGKAFIPYYYGDDVTRMQWHYKGVGRVIFTGGGAFGQGGGKVEWVEYDPQETGYRR